MKPTHILSMLMLSIVSAFRFGPREDHYNSYATSPHDTGAIGRVAEAAFPVRYLLAAKGSAAASIILSTATTEPLGPCSDTPAIGDRATVHLLGATEGTRTMIASKALAENVRVYTTAAGKITDTAVNNCWLVGKTAEAADGDGSPVEVIPCFPVKQTVE